MFSNQFNSNHYDFCRAQKRMNGQDVFGHAILVEMTSQRNVQGPPLMQGHFQGPRPPHGNVHRPPPLPNHFIGAPPFPVHHHRPPLPPPTMEPLMISDVVPYLDNPLNVVLKFLPLGTGRVVVHPINPPGLVDDVQVLKRIKGELAQMAVCAQPPVIVSTVCTLRGCHLSTYMLFYTGFMCAVHAYIHMDGRIVSVDRWSL